MPSYKHLPLHYIKAYAREERRMHPKWSLRACIDRAIYLIETEDMERD